MLITQCGAHRRAENIRVGVFRFIEVLRIYVFSQHKTQSPLCSYATRNTRYLVCSVSLQTQCGNLLLPTLPRTGVATA